MRSVIKKSRPGRAARGKLGNTALYCTHDISFPLFDFFLIFWGVGVRNKHWHYMFLFYTLLKLGV